MDGEYRAGGAFYDLVGDAAEDHPFETGAAVSTHDDQVDFFFLGKRQDLFSRSPQFDAGFELGEFFKKFPKLETRVELGAPDEKILAFVQKEKVDMIIMGAHGRAGLERVIFGSVANKVVKSAPCPVLTIHP